MPENTIKTYYDNYICPEWSKDAEFEYGTFYELSEKHTLITPEGLATNDALPYKPLFLVDKKSSRIIKNNSEELPYTEFSLRDFESLAILGFIFCNLEVELQQRVMKAWVKKYSLPCYTALKEYRRPRGFYNYGNGGAEFIIDRVMHEHWEIAYKLETVNKDFYFIFETTLRGMAFDAYFAYLALLIERENKSILNLVELDAEENTEIRDKLIKIFIEHEFLQTQRLEGKYNNVINFEKLAKLVMGFVNYDNFRKDLLKERYEAKLKRTNEALAQVDRKYGTYLYAYISNMVDEYIYRVAACTNKPKAIDSFDKIGPAYIIPDHLSKIWFDYYHFICFAGSDFASNLIVNRCKRPQCGALFVAKVKRKGEIREYCCDNCREVYRNYKKRSKSKE